MTFQILVVDDEPAIHEVMLVYLKRFLDDFELIIATSGEEALTKASEAVDQGRPPDIVLMDMKMPNMNGLECTKKLVELGVKNVHLLTAYLDPESAKQAVDAGAKGVIRKSEGFKSVAKKVADMIRGTREPSTPMS
ncbi:MAG: response regulator transcription factor [Candidatus Thorarchaeota archaeon]|jgi:CheY-like chemotaxis protein